MEFELRHAFDVDADTLWATVMDPAYERAVAEHTGTPRELLLDERRDDGVRVRRHRVRPREELPRAVRRALGVEHLSYVLEEEIRAAERRIAWRVVPEVAAERVRAEGSYEVRPAGGGAERLVRGRVDVSIPLVGRTVERLVGEQLRRGYEDGVAFLREWLAARRAT